MAKSNYELHDFSAGTITNGDAGDIPPGAAQDSLNISSISKLGVAQTIMGHLEINKDNETDVITGIPPISSMIVRDGDDNSYDLAVNIDKYFILVEKYRSDRLLGDFVGVVKKGQLLSTSPTDYTDIANWSLVSLTYSSPSLTLEAGYGYEISLGHVTTATLTTTPSTIKIKNADGTYAKFADGTDVKEFYDTTSIKEIFYAESDSTTVIELTKGTGTGTPSWEKPVRIQLSKAKYLFSELGTNIDMTETERGLFLSSTIKAPMVQHKIADSSGDIKKYLVTSKCATPTSVNALSNIDQMIWVKDAASGTEYRLICSIYGVNKIWQLVYNTSGATPYYEFNPSNVIAEMPKGVGGLVQTDEPNTFYSWDFEGFNIHKLELPAATTTVTSGFDVTVAKTYSISVEDIPDDGWIASVASAKAGNQSTDPILYVLFTRAGGLREEDNILVAIDARTGGGHNDYKSDANNNLKVLYKLPSYQSATAYTSHSFERNWLGIKDDVNPTGPTDFYWTKESTAKLVPYRDGDFADITHYTKYGYAKDVCWINTASEPVSMDINEGGIVVTTQLDSNIDCVWFSAKPLGETKFLTYSGVWQEAKQWPNNWFDTSSDGEWTHQSEEQKFTRFNNFIGVASHDIGTSTSPTWSDIKEFSMKQVPATGPDIAKAWDDCYGYMIALEQATFPTEVVTNDNATTNSAKRWYVSDRSSDKEVLTNAQKEKIENDESDYTDDNKTSFSDVNLIASTGLLKLEQEVMKSGEWFNLKAKLKAFDTNIESAINSLRSNVLSKVKFTHKDVTGVRNSDGNYPNKTSDRILKFSSQFDNVPDGPLYTYRSLKSTYSALHNALQTVLGYADVKTIATLDPAQITHIPILGADAQDVLQKLNLTHLIDDVGFPFANPITQMQSYTISGPTTKILFSSMGEGGIPTFAEATLTSTGATPLKKLGNTTLVFDDRHTAGTGKMFTTPITNADTGEVEDASEFWALYKPSGSDHAIKNVSGSGGDSDTDEGILVATYTGQLMLKNYEFTNTSTINGKFNSGDLVVGLKADESASNTLVTPAGTISAAAENGDNTQVTYTQSAGADIATGDSIVIAGTTDYNGAHIIKDLDAANKKFVIDVTFTSDQTGTWAGNATDNPDVPFKMNETYLYNMSFLYDGYQEGPLMSTPVTVGPLAANYTALHIDVKLANSNPRVTDIQIYRKKTAAEKFRLVHSAKFNSDWSATTSGQSEMMSALEIGFKDYGDTGIAYDALTGMPETLQSTNFDTYGESAQIGNYLFVANATHPKLIDSQKMIFRSQPTKFSMFNWAQDYVGMPEKIYTLQSHNNRLYAWSKKAMYRIDPYQMLLEQTYEGMGLSGKQSCISIDGLMFIANKNAIYMFNAGRFRKINQTIEDRYNALWKKYPNQKVILSQDKRYNSLLVKFSNQGPNSIDYAPTESFAYSLDKNRWDIWSLPARVTASCINEDNELMICAESSNVVGQNVNGESIDSEGAVITNPFSLYEMHRGSSKEPLSWTSKSLVFGEDGRDKKVKTIRLVGRDVVLESMIVDGTETLFSSTVDSVTKPIIATSNSGDSKSDSYFQEWRLNQLKDPHTGNKIDYTIKRARAIALKIRSLNTLDDNSSEALEPSISSIGVTWSPKSFK